MTYFHLGPYAEDIPWGAPPPDETTLLLRGRNGERLMAAVESLCLVRDWSAPTDIQELDE